MRHEVRLPPEVQPVFPDRCVVCRRASPAHKATLISRDGGFGVFWWRGWHRVKVPCCWSCAVRLHLWRFWDVVRLFVIAIGAFVFCLFVLEPVMPGWLAGWICLGLFVAGILVVYAWNRYFPPAFNVCNLMGLGIVDYEFRDEELAEEFRELNQADVIEDWP